MTILFKREGLTCTKDGDHIIMEGGTYGTRSIYAPEWDKQRHARIQAHWKGYCENNGIDLNTGEHQRHDDIEELCGPYYEVGEYFCIDINQGTRDAIILGTLDGEMIIEYTMPAGTTALQIMKNEKGIAHGK